MSMFKKLKGLFIEEDENASAQPKQKVEQTPEADTTPEPQIEVDLPDPPPTVNTGKPDTKFVDILLKAVEKNNTEGFDYLEYKSSLQSLANMEMDEATKYKSALAMAKTMGATPAKLIASANHYLNVLKKENAKFKEALKSQKAKQVTSREGSIKTTMKSIEDKKKQIAQLQKEIATDEKKLEQLKSGINKAAAKVQATGDSFNHAFNVVTGQIQQDIKNMEQYLK